MKQLAVRDLVKMYHRKAVVNKVSLHLTEGEIVGLLGPNGAGKTTTFYMIVGLTRPNQGTVLLNQENISDLPMYLRARKGINYLPQEPSVFTRLTVGENIMAILETLDISAEERETRLAGLLKELKLTHLDQHKAYSLSGGERRRVEITRALVTSPSFILLDEPFAGIDPLAVNDIQNIIEALKAKNIGILISDHNVRETLSVCDRAYIIHEGKVLEEGTPQELAESETARKIYLGEKFQLL
ncbi:MAG: LPS export ABC transporter ATP-binding protein [Deltaproteobacteria bacterium]|nr:LPS export ABC transporter ATP-binding protein [Deltaproteobacteria bacterium]